MKTLTTIFLFLYLSLSAQNPHFQLGSHKVNIIIDDKTKHVYAGMGITVSSAMISNHFLFKNKQPLLSIGIGFIMGTLAGIVKESIWDKRMHFGTCDNRDAYATSWGSLVGTICVIIYFDNRENKLTLQDKPTN